MTDDRFPLPDTSKNRSPSWIKLHADVLEHYAFSCLQDASKAHLMLLWLLASRMENKIPYDLVFITQKIGASGPVDVEVLIEHGFVTLEQDDSTTLAPRKQSAPLEEKRREEKREKKPSASQGSKNTWLTPICTKWEEYNGEGSFSTIAGQAAKALSPIRKAGSDEQAIAVRLGAYLFQTDKKFRSITKFAQGFDSWKLNVEIINGELSPEFERLTRPT